MATGKKATDIFARTSSPATIGLEVEPRIKGRPQAAEPYQKLTVCLFDKQTLWLDKIALAIREKTGKTVKRSELIRAIVDHAQGMIDPAKKDFDAVVRDLLQKE